jgi:DNA-binding transcriptional regulator YiaG
MQTLKQEISRIARKEAKALTNPIRQPGIVARRAIADLRRRVASLEKANRALQAGLSKRAAAQPAAPEPVADTARITARGIRSLRRRLRLSGRGFATLLGVTDQAVYNMEKGDGPRRVRPTTRTAILGLRGVGPSEARKRVEETLKAKKPAVRRKAGARKGKKR